LVKNEKGKKNYHEKREIWPYETNGFIPAEGTRLIPYLSEEVGFYLEQRVINSVIDAAAERTAITIIKNNIKISEQLCKNMVEASMNQHMMNGFNSILESMIKDNVVHDITSDASEYAAGAQLIYLIMNDNRSLYNLIPVGQIPIMDIIFRKSTYPFSVKMESPTLFKIIQNTESIILNYEKRNQEIENILYPTYLRANFLKHAKITNQVL